MILDPVGAWTVCQQVASRSHPQVRPNCGLPRPAHDDVDPRGIHATSNETITKRTRPRQPVFLGPLDTPLVRLEPNTTRQGQRMPELRTALGICDRTQPADVHVHPFGVAAAAQEWRGGDLNHGCLEVDSVRSRAVEVRPEVDEHHPRTGEVHLLPHECGDRWTAQLSDGRNRRGPHSTREPSHLAVGRKRPGHLLEETVLNLQTGASVGLDARQRQHRGRDVVDDGHPRIGTLYPPPGPDQKRSRQRYHAPHLRRPRHAASLPTTVAVAPSATWPRPCWPRDGYVLATWLHSATGRCTWPLGAHDREGPTINRA